MVGGCYCRLQMPLRPALGMRDMAAGRRPGALEGGYLPPIPMHRCGGGGGSCIAAGTQGRGGSPGVSQGAGQGAMPGVQPSNAGPKWLRGPKSAARPPRPRRGVGRSQPHLLRPLLGQGHGTAAVHWVCGAGRPAIVSSGGSGWFCRPGLQTGLRMCCLMCGYPYIYRANFNRLQQ